MLPANVCFCLLQITGCSSPGKTVSIVVRGSNKLVIEEAERSIHDALCVIRCLVKKRSVISAELISQTRWGGFRKGDSRFRIKRVPPSLLGHCLHIHPLTKALLHWFILQECNKQRNSTVESSPFVHSWLSQQPGRGAFTHITHPSNLGMVYQVYHNSQARLFICLQPG